MDKFINMLNLLLIKLAEYMVDPFDKEKLENRVEDILDFLKESSWASEKEKMGNVFLNFSIILFFTLIVSFKQIIDNITGLLAIDSSIIKNLLGILILINFIYICYKLFTSQLPNKGRFSEIKITIDQLFSTAHFALFVSLMIVILINMFLDVPLIWNYILIIILFCLGLYIFACILFEKYIKPGYLHFYSSLSMKHILASKNNKTNIIIHISNNFGKKIKIKIYLEYDNSLINIAPPIGGQFPLRNDVYQLDLLKNHSIDYMLEIEGKMQGTGNLNILLQHETYKKIFDVSVSVK